jgi:DNA-binding transcriptional regulator GbsR (MarR family)
MLDDKLKKEQEIKALNDYIDENVKELIKYENEHNEKYQALQEHLFDNIIDISNILIQYRNMNKYDEDLVEMVKNKLSR